MADETRHYTLQIDIEVRPQDDFTHFQPNSVVGFAPQLGAEWVSGNDAEALRDFLDFYLKHERLSFKAEKGIPAIVEQALKRAASAGQESELADLRDDLLITQVRLTPEFTDHDGGRWWLLEVPAVKGQTRQWGAFLSEAHVVALQKLVATIQVEQQAQEGGAE